MLTTEIQTMVLRMYPPQYMVRIIVSALIPIAGSDDGPEHRVTSRWRPTSDEIGPFALIAQQDWLCRSAQLRRTALLGIRSANEYSYAMIDLCAIRQRQTK